MSVRAVLIALVLMGCGGFSAPEIREAGRLGRVLVFRAHGAPRGLVFLFSDEAGWSADWDVAARALRDRGAVVVGVNLPTYLEGLRLSDDGCHYLISEIEDLSKQVQHDLGSRSYQAPILAGTGAGGVLAYAALAQSPAATVAGAISVDPAAVLATRVPLCAGAPARVAPGGFTYGPAPDLPGFWKVSAEAPLPPDLAPLAEAVKRDSGSRPERLAALAAAALAAGDGSSAITGSGRCSTATGSTSTTSRGCATSRTSSTRCGGPATWPRRAVWPRPSCSPTSRRWCRVA